MKLIEFPEQTVVIAKDQPEYQPLPAHRRKYDPEGRVTCCWKLTWRERLRLLVTGTVWHQILTFNAPLQPQLLLVDKPELLCWTTRPRTSALQKLNQVDPETMTGPRQRLEEALKKAKEQQRQETQNGGAR